MFSRDYQHHFQNLIFSKYFLEGGVKDLQIKNLILAAIAQLGERQTEDLKVPGSIPGGGILLF